MAKAAQSRARRSDGAQTRGKSRASGAKTRTSGAKTRTSGAKTRTSGTGSRGASAKASSGSARSKPRPADAPARGNGPAQRSGGEGFDGLADIVTGPADEWSLDATDTSFRDRQRFLFDLLSDHYFRVQTDGWHRLPDAPTLVVGIHAGGILPVDAWLFAYEWLRRFEQDREMKGTAHAGLLATPVLGDYMRKMGVLPAAPEPMLNALRAGLDVCVYPGGDRDALRPWTKRDKVELAGRKGFVKLAIRAGVPIVPVATVGAGDTVIMLTSGRRVAKTLRLDKLLQAKVVPIAVGLPYGIAPGLLPFLPLPAKLRYEILEPVEVVDDPDKADDARYVKSLYDRVERRMQAGMDRLAKRRSFPLLG